MFAISIDDRHFEVIIRQMLDKLRVTAVGDTGLQVGELVSASQLEAANAALGEGERAAAESTIVGVTDAASATEDFVAAATTHGGVPALARAAARKQSVALTGVRSCTTFGKVVPARASD
jgi:DNA-directed RNA polymerase subunit beta'